MSEYSILKGSDRAYPTPEPRILQPQPTPKVSVFSLFNSAYERLAVLEKQTHALADFLRGSQPMQTGNAAEVGQGDPSMLERLRGLHQLIALIESNFNDIQGAIG